MVPCISFLCTSHSPNHAYMHEIIHLEHPPYLEKTTSQKNKRVYQKLQKGLKSILLLREFAKGKNHQQKQKFTKATKNASDQYFLRWNLERKKHLQYNIQP